MNKIEIEKMVRQVVMEALSKGWTEAPQSREGSIKGGELPDLREKDLYTWVSVPEPADAAGLALAAASTPARIGTWRSGPRPPLEHWLRFRADHAAANDAVLREVPSELVERLGFFEVSTRASSKEEFLTRPDLGRTLSEEAAQVISKNCPRNARVQLVLADGLSSAAIEENAADFVPAFEEVLKSYGLSLSRGFFVRHGRVGIMDAIGEILDPEVLVLLIGERPGLVTSRSMSAYMAYRPSSRTIESDRTLVANIHPGGIPAIEAAAHVAGIVRDICGAKASGMRLRQALGQ
jgi:ethanolamine ammonia-lyase small subunit